MSATETQLRPSGLVSGEAGVVQGLTGQRHRLGRKLRRLRAMGLDELVVRGRQEVLKRLERIGVIRKLHTRPRAIFSKPASEMSLARFQETAATRFFEGAACLPTQAARIARMPDVREQIVAAADDACRGRFNLLGYPGLFFGDPIDWHLDPIAGRRAPQIHWSRIDPLDLGLVGDHKVVWELNRHQWFVGLGQAYRLTGDERYGEFFVGYIRRWMQGNPPGIGINWASSLELALRLISWVWALFLFRDAKALSSELFRDMLVWIHVQAIHIERYLSSYSSPNTHLTGEALGLFYVGTLFPELREAERWRALATKILVEQSERQIHADGVYFEQSTYYQRYTVEMYLHFLILAARNGMPVPAVVGTRVQRMLDFLLAVDRPDGSMPQIGDADGGTLLPLARRAPDDFRGVFATAAVFFNRADYAWAAGELAPETVWLLGTKADTGFAALSPVPPPAASRHFPQGGYAVMRSGWEQDAHQLIFDIGPLGCPVSGGHGHADLLGIQCAVFGEACLVDPGTYCYTADMHWRNYFRSSAAHSTVTVDGISQALPDGPFAWQRRPRARLRRWLTTPSFDLADASHNSYRRLPDPVTHRRRVLFSKHGGYWIVVDDLYGRAAHRIDLRFQFAPMDVSLSAEGWVRARRPSGRELLVRAFAAESLDVELVAGELSPMRGWVSPVYGQRELAPVLTYSTVARLPLRVATLLLPVDGTSATLPAVTSVIGDGRFDLVFDDTQETIHIKDRDIVVDQQNIVTTMSSLNTGGFTVHTDANPLL